MGKGSSAGPRGSTGALGRGEERAIRNGEQPQGQGQHCCLLVPIWGTTRPARSPDGVPSPASQNSLAVKGKELSRVLHNWETRRPPEPSGCRPTIGIKVEQRITGRGSGGEGMGSSEQHQGSLAGGHDPQGHGWGGSSPFLRVQSVVARGRIRIAEPRRLPSHRRSGWVGPRLGGCLDSWVIRTSPRRGFFVCAGLGLCRFNRLGNGEGAGPFY